MKMWDVYSQHLHCMRELLIIVPGIFLCLVGTLGYVLLDESGAIALARRTLSYCARKQLVLRLMLRYEGQRVPVQGGHAWL